MTCGHLISKTQAASNSAGQTTQCLQYTHCKRRQGGRDEWMEGGREGGESCRLKVIKDIATNYKV